MKGATVIHVGRGGVLPKNPLSIFPGRARGHRNGNAKLTNSKVRSIRRQFVSRDRVCGAAALGRKHGVSKVVILAIIHRRAWKHVP